MNAQPPANFRGNTRSFLKKNTLLFRYFAEINLVLGAWYLQWRLTHTINYQALWLAIPLMIAEIYSYFGGVMFTIGLWRPLTRQVRSLDQLMPPMPEIDYPTIDVFVTCYNEPIEIIERTTRAALALDYPANKLQVYVLDDGASATVAQLVEKIRTEDSATAPIRQQEKVLCEDLDQLQSRIQQIDQVAAKPLLSTVSNQSEHHEFLAYLQREKRETIHQIAQIKREVSRLSRCHYIARPKPSDRPHHAKAGNINYALFSGQTSGKFLVTLDTDHILQPQFLKRVLPFFYTYNLRTGRYDDNNVAFVQTPQAFSNLPAGDPFGHSAGLFYGPIQQGKDGLNSAFYTGTNAILRREAIVSVGIKQFSKEYAKDQRRLEEFDLIGAMSTYSITEDMNTAMRLHAHGWKSIYHHELMATGLAPSDLNSMLKQRLRWAQGTIQVLTQENPLTLKGLSFWQRLQYFQTMYSYFSGFATAIYLICPIVYFFTGISPIDTVGLSFAIHFIPVFLANRITFIIATWGISAREVWRSEQYAIGLFPLFIRAVLSVFTRKPLQFQVTPKQRQAGIYLKLVLPQLIFSILTIAGIVWSVMRWNLGSLPNPEVYALNSIWAVYNLLLLSAIIRASVWQPNPSRRNPVLHPRSFSS